MIPKRLLAKKVEWWQQVPWNDESKCKISNSNCHQYVQKNSGENYNSEHLLNTVEALS